MAELTRISGSAAAANALLLGIAASPAAAAIVPENDDRLIIRRGSLGLKGRALNGYVATPKAAAGKKIPGVILIHENLGLNRPIQDVSLRVAHIGCASCLVRVCLFVFFSVFPLLLKTYFFFLFFFFFFFSF